MKNFTSIERCNTQYKVVLHTGNLIFISSDNEYSDTIIGTSFLQSKVYADHIKNIKNEKPFALESLVSITNSPIMFTMTK